ncbi:hypothetical protein BBH99_18525 [Chryseobacterium contaminans]|uniref:Uncharacterized protein n=1 Tax=Chryseobacterium contaminans TaxID=1423959 RepID=A0ABX2XD13_9FLAO|nr:hypothetical protein BBH99_18525 [Chryseobacterium contaminans]
MLYGEDINISIKELTKNNIMKKKSIFLLINLIISVLVRYNLYSSQIPNFVYNIINPRQLQGISNIVFYLSIVLQIILVISIVINYKKMKIYEFIIVGLSVIFLISFFTLIFTI